VGPSSSVVVQVQYRCVGLHSPTQREGLHSPTQREILRTNLWRKSKHIFRFINIFSKVVPFMI
jgi:hypothetical protein